MTGFLARCYQGLARISGEFESDREPTLLEREANAGGETFEVVRQKGERQISTLAAIRVTPENIDQIFTHEYRNGRLGAKAVVHLDDFLDLPTVLFWRTGLKGEGIEFHHRDSVALIERDKAEVSSTMSEGYLNFAAFFGEIPGKEMGELSKTVLDMTTQLDGDAQSLSRQAENVSSVRTKDSFSVAELIDNIGFQMTARRTGGQTKIVALQVDSSIGTAQANRLPEAFERLSTEEKNVLGERYSKMISKAHESVSPEVRGYRTIEVKDLAFFRRFDIPLSAPTGIRLTEMPAN